MTENTQIDAILHGAAFAELSAPEIARGFLRITGSDATRWLNGMVTNNIKDLKPGEGNYNFLLNNQGRIQGDCTIYRELTTESPEYLLETDKSQVDTIQQLLDKFIIMDDVELAPISDLIGIVVIGPKALSVVMALGTANQQADPCSPVAQAPSPMSINLKHTVYAGAPVSLLLTHSPLVPRLEIWSDPDTIASILDELRGTLATEVSAEALESYRILAAIPRYGIDIRNTETAKDLPQETAQTHALHFSKGCYLGQEIVERIHSRGQVHRTFAQFTLKSDTGTPESSLPAVPAILQSNGKNVGELTSIKIINDTVIALGYARREALDTNQPLSYPGGTATKPESRIS